MMFDNVRADLGYYLERSASRTFLKRVFYILTTQEIHGVLIYRFGRWAKYRCRVPVLCQVFRFTYFFLRKFSEMILGIGIWPESEIGPGLKIEHSGGIYVLAKIGRNCRIQQQVTIGFIGGFKGGGTPVLGDDVYVGAGAKVLGDIRIGDRVFIGANAVVIKDVPNDSIAVGVPAVVKPKKTGAAE